MAALRTDDGTDKPITVMLWLSAYHASISLEDADVMDILSSIRP